MTDKLYAKNSEFTSQTSRTFQSYYWLLFGVIGFLFSCKSGQSASYTSHRSTVRKVNQPKQNNNNSSSTQILEATTRVKVTTEMVLAYIDQFKPTAQEHMRSYGVPCSITLAQGILESGAGTGPLCVQANNHFGIKCHNDWAGPSIYHDDDTAQECFRKYDDPNQSFRDHAEFLKNRKRYAALFSLEIMDYRSWAIGLKQAGYATDPKYPDKLIGLIERYQLHQYDAEVTGRTYAPEPPKTPEPTANESGTSEGIHVVIKGDTLYSISKKYQISVDDLRQKNNLSDNTLTIGQQLIIK